MRQPGFLPPVMDLEVTGGLSAHNVTAWARLFMQTLQTQIKRVPMIYSGNWFWRGFMGNPSGFNRYPVWAGAVHVRIRSRPFRRLHVLDVLAVHRLRQCQRNLRWGRRQLVSRLQGTAPEPRLGTAPARQHVGQ